MDDILPIRCNIWHLNFFMVNLKGIIWIMVVCIKPSMGSTISINHGKYNSVLGWV